MLSLIASFLLSIAVVPSYAQTPTLSVDTAWMPGFLDIYVDDVEAMWGFQFNVVYDTGVLTATAAYGIAPFDVPQGPGVEINDAEGYVAMAFSYPMGEPNGLSTSSPVWIATVEFAEDGPGASPLLIKESTIVDVFGDPISHMAVGGEFRTSPGLPLAMFMWTPNGEDPFVGDTLTFVSTSTDPDGFITDWSWDFGDGTTGSGETETHTYSAVGDYAATLTVTDNEANTDSQTRIVKVSPEPIVYGPVDLRNAHAAYRRFSVSERSPETINQFTAWVKNLSPDQETLVRVSFAVTTADGVGLGALTVEGWVAPRALAKFTADFDIDDPTWQYEEGRADFLVFLSCAYADFWIGEYPHFAEGTSSGVKTNTFAVTIVP